MGVSSSLHAQSSASTFTSVGAGNTDNGGIYALDSSSTNDGSYSSAQASQSFTGMDGNGNTQTMTFSGFANGSSTYGQLHADAGGTVTNTYYNASNPDYYNGSTVNPPAHPTSLGQRRSVTSATRCSTAVPCKLATKPVISFTWTAATTATAHRGV